jgi:putative transposase
MPIKRPQILPGEIYHIVIRAIEGMLLFKDKKDYLRMIHDLFEFNDEDPADWSHRQYYEKRSRRNWEEEKDSKRRKLLVELLAFCLMPNHVHLLLKEIKEGGISKFMRKLGAGYGLYYNKRYNRQGHIFQGRYRIVHIKDDTQLQTVFVYIHTNPVSLIIPAWREKGIKKEQLKEILKFLENQYRWSSYLDYLGRKNFPSLTQRGFLEKIMNGKEGCKEAVDNWLCFKKELKNLDQVSLE